MVKFILKLFDRVNNGSRITAGKGRVRCVCVMIIDLEEHGDGTLPSKAKQLGPHSNSLHSTTFLVPCFVVSEGTQSNRFFKIHFGLDRTKRWSDLSICVVCSWLQLSLSLSPHDHVSLCRPTPPPPPTPAERGLSPSAVPGPELTHTHIHSFFFSISHTWEKKVLALSFSHVILLRNSFLRADLKHVVARDLERYIFPINICSPGLLFSFQKAAAYTNTHTHLHPNIHKYTHTHTAV